MAASRQLPARSLGSVHGAGCGPPRHQPSAPGEGAAPSFPSASSCCGAKAAPFQAGDPRTQPPVTPALQTRGHVQGSVPRTSTHASASGPGKMSPPGDTLDLPWAQLSLRTFRFPPQRAPETKVPLCSGTPRPLLPLPAAPYSAPAPHSPPRSPLRPPQPVSCTPRPASPAPLLPGRHPSALSASRFGFKGRLQEDLGYPRGPVLPPPSLPDLAAGPAAVRLSGHCRLLPLGQLRGRVGLAEVGALPGPGIPGAAMWAGKGAAERSGGSSG